MGSWHKYGAKKCVIDGITFMSKAEGKRYGQLKLMEKAGLIEGIICQPKFKCIINGTGCGSIILDFQYYDKVKNKLVYEEVKTGIDLPMSKYKRRILKALYPEIELYVLTEL